MEEIIISSFLLLLIDSIYLSNIGKPMFSKVVSQIQKEKLTTTPPSMVSKSMSFDL